MTRTLLRYGLWAIAVLAIAAGPARAQSSEDDRWQVGTTSSFSSGRYGTDTTTAVIYTPITARRLFADGDVTLVFPFTCISGNGGVTVVNGSPVRNERDVAGASAGDTTVDRPGMSERGRGANASEGTITTTVDAAATTTALSSTVCGMGDVVVRGRYYLVDERGWMPTIAVRAHLKTPTASAERGLGTGRPDEGIGIEVTRTLVGGVMVMVDAGYTVIGKPAGVSYQNNWWYDVGVARSLANGTVNLSVFFEEYRAILPGFESARSILMSVMVRGATRWRLQVSGQLGLTDEAPDRGFTFGASRRF